MTPEEEELELRRAEEAGDYSPMLAPLPPQPRMPLLPMPPVESSGQSRGVHPDLASYLAKAYATELGGFAEDRKAARERGLIGLAGEVGTDIANAIPGGTRRLDSSHWQGMQKDAAGSSPPKGSGRGLVMEYMKQKMEADRAAAVNRLSNAQTYDLEGKPTREADKARAEAKKAAEERTNKLTDDTTAHGRQLERDGINNKSHERAAALSAGQKVEQRNAKQLQDLGKALEGIPSMRRDMEVLGRFVTREDIPGVGAGHQIVPNWAVSGEGLKVRQATKGIVNALLKKQSGSAVSEPEVKRKMDELGMGDGADEAQFREGFSRLGELISGEARASEAAFSPEAVEEYHKRGGVTSQDMPAPGVPVVDEMVPMIDDKGRPRMVPRSKVQQAIKSGGKLR